MKLQGVYIIYKSSPRKLLNKSMSLAGTNNFVIVIINNKIYKELSQSIVLFANSSSCLCETKLIQPAGNKSKLGHKQSDVIEEVTYC